MKKTTLSKTKDEIKKQAGEKFNKLKDKAAKKVLWQILIATFPWNLILLIILLACCMLAFGIFNSIKNPDASTILNTLECATTDKSTCLKNAFEDQLQKTVSRTDDPESE